MHPSERVRVNRLAFIIFLLVTGWPLMKFGLGFLGDKFWKKLPQQVQTMLAARRAHNTQDPRSDVRCVDVPSTAGWDYICTYVPNPSLSFRRLKFGVRMQQGQIHWVSPPQPLDARHIMP